MKIKFMKRLGGSVSTRHGKTLLRSLPLVAAGLMLCSSSLRAADSPGVKFNSGVRYSQWAIDSRLHDFYGNQKKFGFDYYDKSGTRTKEVTWSKLGSTSSITKTFDYVAGLVGKVTLEAADFYEGFDWSKPWFYAAQGYAKETPYSNSSMTLDNMNAAKMYLPILAGSLKSDAATNVANEAIAAVIKDMKEYNSTYSIGGSKSGLNSTNANDVQKTMFGGWFHKSTDYTDQMWCDGQYMGPALLAQIIKYNGKTNNISDNDWDIIAKQFSITWAQLYDSNTGLLYHGFAANPGDTNSSSWAGISKDNGIYHSASFWGRANAWYFLALVDILEAMPTDNTYYNTFKGYLTNLAAGIKNYQDSETGCWYQVLDKTPASLTGNYLEASCSSIFTAAYLKAIRLGLLDKDTYENVAKKAYEGLVNQFMVYDNSDNNTVQLVKSCTSAGLGGSYNRAGDDNYYLTGKDAGVVTSSDPSNKYYYTEGKVLGGFIMAATEYERAYQNQDSKQILFAKDLAPTYDFSSTSGTLDATAYGSATPTYQWYKDGSVIADATSATYTPTESGTYKCTATANSTTITTSEAVVTAKSATSGEEETTKTVTFPVDQLKTLDSNPESGEVSSLTTEAITIKAGTGISANKTSLKLSKNNGSDFTISADGAKITKITFVTNSRTRNLTSDPQTTPTDDGQTWTYDFSTSKPSSIKFTNASSSNINVTEIQVEYESSTPSTPKTDLTATYSAESVSATVGDDDIQAPALTVKAGEKELSTDAYSVSYVSSKGSVVKVVAGKLTAVAAGEATVTATVTPTDNTAYNGTSATFNVVVSKKDLVATFSPQAVSANAGDEARALPTLTVKDKQLDQPITDYTVTYTSTNEAVAKVANNELQFVGAGKTTVKATIVPNEDISAMYNTCEASFDVSVSEKSDVDPTETTVVYDFTTSVGNTESANTGITVNSDNIKFGTNFKPVENKYLIITPKGDGGFKAGDVVTIKGNCPKANSGILLYADPNDDEPQFQTPAFSAEEVTYTFTIQKDCDVLYLGRFGGSTTYVTSLNVTRPASSDKARLTAAFAKNSDVIIYKTENYTVDLPELTVKSGDNVLTKDKYSVVYSSNNESIASVDNGKITVKTTGTVTILATVTPTDEESYEGCTATYTITIKEATPLSITINDVNVNTTDANVKQPTVKVYGDNDKLLTNGTDYTLTYSVAPATEGETANVSVSTDGVFSVSGDKYNWTAGTSVITVTATPAASLGETFTAGTATFNYNVVKGKLTPAFLNNFTTETVKVKQYDSKTNKTTKDFTVPLIYDGEDVSEYFNYTFYIDGTEAKALNKNNKVNGSKLTLRPDLTEGDHTIKVTATVKTSDKEENDYSDVYNNPTDVEFTINVSSSYIKPTVEFDPASITMYTGTTEGAQDIIVKNGNDVMDESQYTVSNWVSFTPSFVKVDATTGKLEALNEGTGSVRVTVTGDNLETTTAFLTVYVDDPAMYRAKDKDNNGEVVTYGNQKVMWNQNKTMAVTLGGWMFPNDVTEGLTYDSGEGLKKEYAWGSQATQPKWKMSGFNRFVSGDKSKNARQEDGSNAQVNTTMISTADFKTKGEIKDRMFNVPCSGSYLVFNPATNGTVNVHIFQNGVFDSGFYRPQRRVFVMDEQGNFVQSTPEIENANGKPTGGLKALSSYKWDINPNGAGTAPTIDQVRSHFKDIPKDFDMTAEKFQNNVLESDLSADIVPNAAYDKDVEGSNGWCVLADSPVTYTFNVKAGKTYYLWNFGSKIGFYGFSFKEDATKPEIDDVTYDEAATDNQIVSTPAGHMAKVSINRHIKKGIWNACVLPFSLNKHQVDALFGDTYMMGCENGTQILYFDHVDANGKVWFVRHAYNTIVANKPFLIKPTKEVEVINTADCADYPYVTIEAPDGNKPADWCSDGKYAWVSSYNNDMTLAEGDGYIGGTSGSFIQSTKSDVKVKGFRGYLKGLTPEAKAHALSTATSSNTEENGSTTFIEGLTIDAEGNIVPMATDGKVYNINGQVVADGMKNLNALPSGVYIINGKKYVK